MRRKARTVLILAATVLLMAFFLRNANLQRVWVEIKQARLELLVAAFVTTAMTYLVRALRWQCILMPIGGARLSTVFRTTVIGFAATFLLPARAGEFIRPYLLARREGLSATATFATIVLERLFDAVAVLLLLGIFLIFFDPGMVSVDSSVFNTIKISAAISTVGALLALGVIFFLAGRPDRLGRMELVIERVLPARFARILCRLLQRFVEGLAVMRQPGRLFIAVALSFPLWLSISFGIWLVALAFHINLPYTGSFVLLALLVVGVAIPTPGGIGGFHAAFQIGVTAFYAAPNDRAIGAALVMHAVSFIPVTLLGIIFIIQDGLSLRRMGSLGMAEDYTKEEEGD